MTGNYVTVVTNYVMKITITCSTITGHLFDTVIVALTNACCEPPYGELFLFSAKRLYILGQLLIQNWLSDVCPLQYRPPYAGAGFVQVLLRFLTWLHWH